MTCWDGTVVKKKNGKPVRIEVSLDVVFELIRRNFSSDNAKDFIKMQSIADVKEFLSVCYHRRCCYAHKGACNSNNSSICDCNNADMVRCKASLALDKGRISDPVLNRLEMLVRDLIYKAIRQEISIREKETRYLYSLIEEGCQV